MNNDPWLAGRRFAGNGRKLPGTAYMGHINDVPTARSYRFPQSVSGGNYS